MRRLVTFTALFFLCLSAACRRAPTEARSAGKFAVTTPLRADTELTREYVAQLKAIQHIELRALERGYLQGVFVDEGQRVGRGTRLFQLMPLVYQAEFQKAEAEAQLRGIELDTTRALADKNVVSSQELAKAKARAASAKAEVALARTNQSLTELRAPFDGLVGRFHVRVGSLLDEGDLLTTLADNSTLWVYFNVSEAEYLTYKSQPKGEQPDRVRLRMANGEEYGHAGRVETIEADFNNDTGNIAFRANFPNPDGLLRHGETGTVMMSVPLKNALIIPQKATFDVLDRKFAFVVDAQQVVHARPIVVAAEKSQVFVVGSGLSDGEQVLLEGLRRVTDGAKIEVDLKDPRQVLDALKVAAE